MPQGSQVVSARRPALTDTMVTSVKENALPAVRDCAQKLMVLVFVR